MVSPGALVEPLTSVSEEDEADDSPSPELGGKASRELRMFGETLVVQPRWTRGEQMQLGLDSVALFVEKRLLLRSSRIGVRYA